MGRHLSIDMFGARPATEYTDGAMTAGSAVFTSASAAFTSVDTGIVVVVPGALGASVDPLIGIGTYLSPTQMTLSVSATSTVSAVSGVYGPNSQPAINLALANCRKRNYGSVFVPASTWLVRGAVLSVPSGVTVYGFGRSSVIYAADYTNSGFYASAKDRVTVRDLAFRSHAKVRGENSSTGAVWFVGCTNISLRNLYIDGGKAAGLYVDNCTGGEVENIEAQNTLADGVHIVGGSKRIRVRGINGYRTGDDTVAVVSYLSQPQCSDIHVSNVVSIDCVNGRGISSIGSKDVIYDGFRVVNPGSHGAICAYESPIPGVRAETHTPSGCRFLNGVIEDVDAAPGFNAIIITGEDSSHVVDDVEVSNVTLRRANQSIISFASNVRVTGCTIRDGIYNGFVVTDSEDIEISGNRFKSLDESAIVFDAVDGGRIDNNDLTECQSVTANGSKGRLQVVNCTDVVGSGNRDKRSAVLASYGPLLSSSNTRCHLEVSEIDVDGAASYKLKGHQYNSATKQLFVETDRPVNDAAYGLVMEKGAYFHDGPVQIEGNHALTGSGGAAWLKLFGGFGQLSSPSSLEFHINSDSSGTGETLTVWASLTTRLLALTTAGDLFTRGGLLPNNTASGHGFFAITGASPNGVIAAPVGSWCLRDWGSLTADGLGGAPAYYKASGGTTSSGWVEINLTAELPSISGNARKSLRVNNGGTGINWSKVPIDDPGAIELLSISDQRYIYHTSGGQLVGRGPADIWAAIEATVNSNAQLASTGQVTGLNTRLDAIEASLAGKADIGHGHSGTTGSGGTPSHTHGWST